MGIKNIDEKMEKGRFRCMAVDNTGAMDRPTFGYLKIRKNQMHLAGSRSDFSVQDTVEGRAAAKAALENGMYVYDLAGNALTAEDLTEKE